MNIDQCFEERIKLYAVGYNKFRTGIEFDSNSKDFTDFENITGLFEILIPFKNKNNNDDYYGIIKRTTGNNLYCFKELDENDNLIIINSDLFRKDDIHYFNFVVELLATDLGNNVPGNIKLLRKFYINNQSIDNNELQCELRFERSFNNEIIF